jgi:hypothetical protein
MTTTQTATVHAIQPDVAAALRRCDDAGRAPIVIVEDEGGSPLRCCLTSSRPGERVVLASYAPLRRWAADTGAAPGPYDEVGPVFLHAEACAGPAGDGYPSDFRGLPRVLRAYDANGHIVGGRVIAEGEAPEPAIDEVLADPSVAFVHARALVHGCYTFAITRG